MLGHTKKHLTSSDIVILVRGKEIELKGSIRLSIANIINELIDVNSSSAKEIHGEWLLSPRMRVAKYLKGIRKREGLTQLEVCKILKIEQSNLSKMENGERPIPKNLILRFSKLFKIKKEMITERKINKALKKGKK